MGHSLQLTSTNTAGPWSWSDDQLSNFSDTTTNPTTWTPTSTGAHNLSDGTGLTQQITVDPDPVAGFSGPASADVGQEVSFDAASHSTGTGLAYEWDLGTGSFSAGAGTQPWTPSSTGPQTIRLRITDENGIQDTVSRVVNVVAAPVASLLASAPATDVGQTVTLTSVSTGTGLTQAWQDSQPGSFGGATAQMTSWTPTAAGTHTIKLTVTDANGVQTSISQDFVVSSPPAAAITFSPANPVVGQPVTFHSASTGGAGALNAAWDLTGSGAFFAPATDPSWTPTAAGAHGVALRVTDANGVSSEAFVAFNVAPPSAPSGPAPPALPSAPSGPAPPGWLVPFPIVVFSGHVGHRSATFTHFVVQAPNGARITVHCRGSGCPRGSIVKVAAARHGVQSVRLRKLERRLSAGAVIEVFVRSPGLIGKYTKISVLSTQPPRRSDACLMPGQARPSACPTN